MQLLNDKSEIFMDFAHTCVPFSESGMYNPKWAKLTEKGV